MLSMLASSVASSLLPIADPTLRMQAGIVVGNLASQGISKMPDVKGLLDRWNPWRVTTIAVEPTFEGMPNPIYKRLEQMITSKYQEACSELRLAPTRGEVSLDVSTKHMNVIRVPKAEGGPINIELDLSRTGQDDSKSSGETAKKPLILLKSKSLTAAQIQAFVERIMSDTSLVPTQTLSVYSPRFSNGSKDSPSKFTGWEEFMCKTNKNRRNVVLEPTVDEAFFGGIERFLESEDLYKTRGIPYKCNFILSGPPGTGKSSMILAAAATHKLPLFLLTPSCVTDDEELNNMQLRISYYARNSPYFLVLDDLDRLDIFNYREGKITQSGLLGLLDGVPGNYGCIIIMCVNDRTKLNRIHAFTRPGRVDHDVIVGHCTREMVPRFMRVYFGRECDQLPEGWEQHAFQIGDNTSGAQIMGVMGEAGSAAAALDLLCDPAKMKEHHDAMASAGLRGNLGAQKRRTIKRRVPLKGSAKVKQDIKHRKGRLVWFEKQRKKHEVEKAKWGVEEAQYEEKLQIEIAREKVVEEKRKAKEKKQAEVRKRAAEREKAKKAKEKEQVKEAKGKEKERVKKAKGKEKEQVKKAVKRKRSSSRPPAKRRRV